MRKRLAAIAIVFAFGSGPGLARRARQQGSAQGTVVRMALPAVSAPAAQGGPRELKLDQIFYETASGQSTLPASLSGALPKRPAYARSAKMPDGRVVSLSSQRQGKDYVLSFSAKPDSDITRWGFAADCAPHEYFTGLMERLVDGPQYETWRAGRTEALNLRGQSVDMLVKPTLSVYAPFYLSSRGYAIFVQGTWPGHFDFCAQDAGRVKIWFYGPSLRVKIYTASNPAALVRAHAMDAGPPVLPPSWIYGPWRWRDEVTQRTAYYDGTPVTGPFNSEFMEDVLMMKAYGIPNSIYWIDRPWGPGRQGYDDFEIDAHRLPNFADSIKWLNQQGARMVMWIGPFFQGRMAEEALAKHYNLPDQKPPRDYPTADFSNPAAKQFWQDGVAQLLRMGVDGFKMDRSEENMPDDGPDKIFDGRWLREERNDYPAMYVRAADEIARKFHADGDYVLMPRAAYTGSSRYAVFWGGDIAGTPEGLRAEIVAVQRAAVMGYPNWGSDSCGYQRQTIDDDVCSRWLEFSAFTAIMEVGPTRNVGFWDLPAPPAGERTGDGAPGKTSSYYDERLIATWRLYARLHQRLAAYSYKCAQEAHRTGMPVVRPLFLADPRAPEAWSNWWTYLYGQDLVVSHIWAKGETAQQVYLPRGSKWRDAWSGQIYGGGLTITAHAALHQIPIYVRVGSRLNLGDLNREWRHAQAAAHNRPDLKSLDASVREWFERPHANQ